MGSCEGGLLACPVNPSLVVWRGGQAVSSAAPHLRLNKSIPSSHMSPRLNVYVLYIAFYNVFALYCILYCTLHCTLYFALFCTLYCTLYYTLQCILYCTFLLYIVPSRTVPPFYWPCQGGTLTVLTVNS